LEIIITPPHTFTLGSRHKGEGETKANQEYQYRKVGFERSSRDIFKCQDEFNGIFLYAS
jgi:hypothetical protein